MPLNRAVEWVAGGVQPWVLAGLTLVGVALFAASLWAKLRILLRARSDDRTGRVWERMVHTLRIAFGQSKLFKETAPGWMHALIFWGFCVLLARAGQFFFIGFFPALEVRFPAGAGLCAAYALVKDVFVVVVTLACGYGLYRRLVVKPSRLTLSFQGNLILALIIFLMVTDVLFDAAWTALHPETADSWNLLGRLLAATLLRGTGPGVLTVWHESAYWAHLGAILIFLNLLPHSKHFHILTSIPNVYFSNPARLGNPIRRLDFDDESRQTFGVVGVEDFTWKQLLDAFTCTECGRCDAYCPAFNSGKPLSPQQLTLDVRSAMAPATQSPLLGGAIKDDTLWACTTCGACEEECPVMIEYVDKIVGMRRGLVLTESRFPHELNAAFKSLEVNSNPWGFARDRRGDWAQGLDVKLWDKERPTEYLYFAGCNGAYDARGRKIAVQIVSLLRSAGVDFSILGAGEGCTGDPARRLGNEYLFDQLAGKNVETLRQQGVRKIVTHCPHCFNSFKNEYPEFGLQLEVIHHSELLAQLVREGRLTGAPAGEVVVHDSCYLGRHNDTYDAPRAVLQATAETVREPQNTRERGTCCGAGGGRFLLEESAGTRINSLRLGELMQTGAETVAVSCPFCVLMLEDAVKTAHLEGRVRVRDIAELLGEQQSQRQPRL
jgi:Fe-S oxidoreductase